MTSISSIPARARAALLGLLAALAVLAVAPPAEAADLLTNLAASTSSTQAGAPADLRMSFETSLDERVAAARFHLPPGLLGTIANFPTCPATAIGSGGCAPETQVGVADVLLRLDPSTPVVPVPGNPVYHMETGPGDTALLGIAVLGGFVVTYVHLDVRPGDYGLDATIDPLPNLLVGADMTLWGVPADQTGAGQRLPFMTNPSLCGKSLPVTVEASSYANPGQWQTDSAMLSAFTGCESLSFQPSAWARADRAFVNEASGFEFGIQIPTTNSADELGTPPMRDVTVVLPEGLTINPSVANGLVACSDGAFGKGRRSASSCPAASKIGTVGLRVPSLPDPHLGGAMYLGEPKPGNPFRLFLEAYGSDVRVKLEGEIRPDAKTGRVSTLFRDNPQVPVSAIKLAFKGGPLAPLAMPSTCGFKPVQAGISSWGGQSANTSALLQVGFDAQGTPCPEALGFAPSFVAGTVDNRAGADAGFKLVFGRQDLDRELGSISLSMPAGLLGRLTAVPLCPAAAAANGSCGAESMVGDARVWAGAGSSPIEVQNGRVYLTQPYRDGDVAGLSIVVRALAGPYDLGTAVVRAGIKVRPDTGLDVQAEMLPTIMEGVPLRIRRVQVDLGRQGFMFNPSDCSPKRITGTITSADGATSDVAVPFQVGGCAGLEFSPAMRIASQRPAADQTMGLDVTVTQDAGEARMRRLTLLLPTGMGARLEGPLQSACTEDDYHHDRCAASSRIGSASATTEVLPFELTSPVHFIENPGGALPRLGVRLRGGPITVDLLGDVTINSAGRIVAVFDGIPDVPIRSFRLVLEQGAQSVLTGTDMCGGKVAELEVVGHSGAVSRQRVALEVPGCPSATERSAANKRAAKRRAVRLARRAA